MTAVIRAYRVGLGVGHVHVCACPGLAGQMVWCRHVVSPFCSRCQPANSKCGSPGTWLSDTEHPGAHSIAYISLQALVDPPASSPAPMPRRQAVGPGVCRSSVSPSPAVGVGAVGSGVLAPDSLPISLAPKETCCCSKCLSEALKRSI